MRCGSRRDRARAEWGRCDGQQLVRALGLTRDQTPCAATWSQVRRQRDRPRVEALLGAWADRVLTALPPAPGEPAALALEGKPLRGRRQPGAPAAPLLSVLSHRLGLTLWPQAGADQTQEIPVLEDVWPGLVVEGRVLPVEALLTPRAIAQRLVAGGGDDVRVVKGHPPQLPHESPRLCQDPDTVAEPGAPAETGAVGHGRLAPRRLTASTALVGDRDWPGLAQVCPLARHVTIKASGAPRDDGVDGVTSLRPEQAGPPRLLGLVRQHWQIEHTVHGVREVTCDEDRSHVRAGSIPQVMAAWRHTAIGVMPWVGVTHSAAACRRFAAQPWAAFALIGIRPDN